MWKSRRTWLVFKVVSPSRRVKETQSEARVEWMNFATTHSSWTLSFAMNIDQILLPVCLFRGKWSLESAAIAWLTRTDWGSTGWRSFSTVQLQYVSVRATSYWSLTVYPGTNIKDQLAVDHNWEWNSPWWTPRKSAAILGPLGFFFFFFWNVRLCVTTKWRTNLKISLTVKLIKLSWKWTF